MKIESVDFFYLSMPEVTDAGDGSQDALVVRVEAGGHVGWGECEASPLVSIAAYVTPMSHGACKPLNAVVLGKPIDEPADIERLAGDIEMECMDLLQAAHTWSGIEMALWDCSARSARNPSIACSAITRPFPRSLMPRSSSAIRRKQTLEGCRSARKAGFRAVKCGWGPFGRAGLKEDRDQLFAAREGLGR